MKWQINFELVREDKNITSKASGKLTADNFESIAEEIERWLEVGAKCVIESAEEVSNVTD